MKKFGLRLMAVLGAITLSAQAHGGSWTSNQFIDQPSLGARGQQEKTWYDSGVDRVDARLGNLRVPVTVNGGVEAGEYQIFSSNFIAQGNYQEGSKIEAGGNISPAVSY